jgi:hypothetical protein
MADLTPQTPARVHPQGTTPVFRTLALAEPMLTKGAPLVDHFGAGPERDELRTALEKLAAFCFAQFFCKDLS